MRCRGTVNGLSQEIFQLGVTEKYEFRWTEQAQDNARKFGDFAAELDRVIGDGWRDLKSLADGVKTKLEKVPLSKYPPSFGTRDLFSANARLQRQKLR